MSAVVADCVTLQYITIEIITMERVVKYMLKV
jgi:hypothetical protein